jgi:hypothetical protein
VKYHWFCLVLAGAVLLTGPASRTRADEILLTNGKTLRGRIVRKDAQGVRIELDNGGKITIPASRVKKVTASARTPRSGSKAQGSSTAAKPAAKKPASKPVGKKLAPALAARIKRLIVAMGSRAGEEARETRKQARESLTAIGADASDALCTALTDAQELRRWGAATVLGRIRSRKAVRALLAAMYLGTPPKGKKAPWWEERYLRACGRSFKTITGTRFDYDPDNVLAGAVAKRMLEWWGRNYKDYPLQWGEKLVKKKKVKGEAEEKTERPDPVKDISKMARRRYPKPGSYARGTR